MKRLFCELGHTNVVFCLYDEAEGRAVFVDEGPELTLEGERAEAENERYVREYYERIAKYGSAQEAEENLETVLDFCRDEYERVTEF